MAVMFPSLTLSIADFNKFCFLFSHFAQMTAGGMYAFGPVNDTTKTLPGAKGAGIKMKF
jgi:hypothetical protein